MPRHHVVDYSLEPVTISPCISGHYLGRALCMPHDCTLPCPAPSCVIPLAYNWQVAPEYLDFQSSRSPYILTTIPSPIPAAIPMTTSSPCVSHSYPASPLLRTVTAPFPVATTHEQRWLEAYHRKLSKQNRSQSHNEHAAGVSEEPLPHWL